MRCKHSTRKRATCGNDLGDARYKHEGESVRCSGCGKATVVNQRHITDDWLKARARERQYIEALKNVPGDLLPAQMRIEYSSTTQPKLTA